MAIGELLLAKGIITEEQLKAVLRQQKIAGGRLGDNLVTFGFISGGDLEAILKEPPPVAKNIQDTGLDANFLLNCLLRTMYISALQTIPELSEQIKLTRWVVEELLTFAKKEALVEIRGPSEKNYNIMRYALTNAGKERASEALRRCEYIGPAPIPLETYQTQVQKQTITNEVISIEKLKKAMPHLEHDPRWVRCRRPYIISGGELTLEMLDLDFDPHSKYYEAPLQMKAIGGIFVIDDFGRQRVRPHELLNRWIFPLERKIDYMTLHTGKKFALLFDQLVIFATNFPPEELMDPAQLRRVHYKMKINPPTVDEFKEIFQRICDSYGLEFSEETMAYLLNTFYIKYKIPFAGFHPKFIAEHVIAACNYLGTPPRISRQLLADSLENMVILPTTSTPE